MHCAYATIAKFHEAHQHAIGHHPLSPSQRARLASFLWLVCSFMANHIVRFAAGWVVHDSF